MSMYLSSRPTSVSALAAIFLSVSLQTACSTRPPSEVASADTSPVVLFAKPVFRKELVDKAIQYEQELSKRYTSLAPPGTAYFEVLDGNSRVLITAPHATCPMRESQQRFADGGTGSLAFALHELADTSTLVTTYAQPSDPNYYDDNDFKRRLADLVSTGQYDLILDLHGSHPNQPYDVDFGTMGGTSVLGDRFALERLGIRLRDQGLVDLSQDFFPASKNETITKWATLHNIPCIQLEINTTWLFSATDGVIADRASLQTHRFTQVLEALLNFVRDWDDRKTPRSKSAGAASVP